LQQGADPLSQLDEQVIHVETLHKFYQMGETRVHALRGLDIEIRRGEFVAIMGASGSGKSTFMNILGCLDKPSSGRYLLEGVDVAGLEKTELAKIRNRKIGFVFQGFNLLPRTTALENVELPTLYSKIDKAERDRRAVEALQTVGLADRADHFPSQLSGGQQQRVAIARALVYEPPVILLDEPLSNLDAKLREEARAWLRTLIVTLGLSAIHVTHDQVEAMAIADRIVLLDAGVVAQEGAPTALYNEPATLFAAEFMGSNDRLDGKLVENSAGRATIELFGERLTGIARTKVAPGGKATGIIRIERVRCTSNPGPNRLKMELKAPMYLGERWELVFARENLSVRAYASAPLEPGEHYVEFPPEAMWVF
jgi:iron(III) transport system ATP-binding protein